MKVSERSLANLIPQKPGNTLAKGRPNAHASRVCDLRKVLMEATTPEEMKATWLNILRIAQSDDAKYAIPAAELVLSRVFGKPKESLEVEVTGDGAPNLTALSPDALASILETISQDAPCRTIDAVVTPEPQPTREPLTTVPTAPDAS